MRDRIRVGESGYPQTHQRERPHRLARSSASKISEVLKTPASPKFGQILAKIAKSTKSTKMTALNPNDRLLPCEKALYDRALQTGSLADAQREQHRALSALFSPDAQPALWVHDKNKEVFEAPDDVVHHILKMLFKGELIGDVRTLCQLAQCSTHLRNMVRTMLRTTEVRNLWAGAGGPEGGGTTELVGVYNLIGHPNSVFPPDSLGGNSLIGAYEGRIEKAQLIIERKKIITYVSQKDLCDPNDHILTLLGITRAGGVPRDAEGRMELPLISASLTIPRRDEKASWAKGYFQHGDWFKWVAWLADFCRPESERKGKYLGTPFLPKQLPPSMESQYRVPLPDALQPGHRGLTFQGRIEVLFFSDRAAVKPAIVNNTTELLKRVVFPLTGDWFTKLLFSTGADDVRRSELNLRDALANPNTDVLGTQQLWTLCHERLGGLHGGVINGGDPPYITGRHNFFPTLAASGWIPEDKILKTARAVQTDDAHALGASLSVPDPLIVKLLLGDPDRAYTLNDDSPVAPTDRTVKLYDRTFSIASLWEKNGIGGADLLGAAYFKQERYPLCDDPIWGAGPLMTLSHSGVVYYRDGSSSPSEALRDLQTAQPTVSVEHVLVPFQPYTARDGTRFVESGTPLQHAIHRVEDPLTQKAGAAHAPPLSFTIQGLEKIPGIANLVHHHADASRSLDLYTTSLGQHLTPNGMHVEFTPGVDDLSLILELVMTEEDTVRFRKEVGYHAGVSVKGEEMPRPVHSWPMYFQPQKCGDALKVVVQRSAKKKAITGIQEANAINHAVGVDQRTSPHGVGIDGDEHADYFFPCAVVEVKGPNPPHQLGATRSFSQNELDALNIEFDTSMTNVSRWMPVVERTANSGVGAGSSTAPADDDDDDDAYVPDGTGAPPLSPASAATDAGGPVVPKPKAKTLQQRAAAASLNSASASKKKATSSKLSPNLCIVGVDLSHENAHEMAERTLQIKDDVLGVWNNWSEKSKKGAVRTDRTIFSATGPTFPDHPRDIFHLVCRKGEPGAKKKFNIYLLRGWVYGMDTQYITDASKQLAASELDHKPIKEVTDVEAQAAADKNIAFLNDMPDGCLYHYVKVPNPAPGKPDQMKELKAYGPSDGGRTMLRVDPDFPKAPGQFLLTMTKKASDASEWFDQLVTAYHFKAPSAAATGDSEVDDDDDDDDDAPAAASDAVVATPMDADAPGEAAAVPMDTA